jgi:hypothetical protein
MSAQGVGANQTFRTAFGLVVSILFSTHSHHTVCDALMQLLYGGLCHRGQLVAA